MQPRPIRWSVYRYANKPSIESLYISVKIQRIVHWTMDVGMIKTKLDDLNLVPIATPILFRFFMNATKINYSIIDGATVPHWAATSKWFICHILRQLYQR